MKRNFTVSCFGICTVLLFVGCSNQAAQLDKFERAVKCRELADRYLKKEPIDRVVTTFSKIIYSESRKTCLAKISELGALNGKMVANDRVQDVLSNRILALSGSTMLGKEFHWYYDDNNVQKEASYQEVAEVMDDLMRE